MGYHALFMQNMLVPPTDAELDLFMGTGENKPFMIYNAGVFPCNRQTEEMPVFGLMQPKTGIKEVPKEILRPQEAWVQTGKTAEDFQKTALNLAGLFQKNFKEYAPQCSPSVVAAGPKA